MLAIFDVPFYIQIASFVVVSVTLLFALRKICADLIKGRQYHIFKKQIIGKKYILLTDLSPEKYGEIKIGDEIWTAKTSSVHAKAGEIVTVYKIKKGKVYVK